jgi:tetratricopeptide (TPR) repeat protein
MGYGHLQIGDTKGAIEIFKLNAAAYPKSPNVYDSLSDAYLADGQKDLAREYAKKAIESLASDTTDSDERRDAIKASAEQKLKDLGDTPK